jgi:DnaK suppressor protein
MSRSESKPADAVPESVVRRLRAELADATQRVEDLDQQHRELLADPGVIQEDRDSSAQLLASARTTLATAQAAVERLAQGTYGTCSNCGEEIPPERLEALPETVLCVSCSG